jgi:hypothetical protein
VISNLATFLSNLKTVPKASAVLLRRHGPPLSDGPAAAGAAARGPASEADVRAALLESGLPVQGARTLHARERRSQAVVRLPALGAVAKVCLGSAHEADAYDWLDRYCVPGVVYPLAVQRLARGGAVLVLPQLHDCTYMLFTHEQSLAYALTPVVEVSPLSLLPPPPVRSPC